MKEKSEIEDSEKFLFSLGYWIKTKRESNSLTQEQVSEKTGIEYKYYQKIEAGRANITMETFHKICLALYIDPINLFK